MNTVYIVDDETIVLDGLVNWVEWSRINVKVLGTATSGMTAFNEILYYKPDVVITDIRMPGKDGLDLIEAVEKVLPQTVFIVMSGYNDFSYAQRALHYGVVEYLLKPIEEEQILEVVEKALLKRKRLDNNVMYPNNIKSVWQIELFNRILNPDTIAAKEEDQKAVTVAVCDISGYTNRMDEVSDKLMSLRLEEKNVYYGRNYTELVVLFTKSEAEEAGEVLKKMTAILETAFQTSFFWGICDQREIPCSYYRAYLHGRQNGMAAAFYGIPQLAFEREDWKEDPFCKERIFSSFCQGETDELVLQKFEGEYAQAKALRIKPQLLKQEAITLLKFVAASLIERFNMVIIPGNQIQNFINLIEDAEDFEHLHCVIENIFKNIRNYYSVKYQDYNIVVVEKIKQFVNDNLQQPINIQSVAEYVNMSPNYITSYFKKYTGMVLSDYILQKKMEKAIDLLENSTMKISRIAAEVGFTDPKYFCKVFKKYANITASDFRSKQISKVE